MSSILPLPGSNIQLSEGEVVVRTYHITNTKRPKARGDVAITNKRIIYQGKGKTSTAVKEVPIESVTAINTYYGSGFRAGLIILGLLFIIAGIATFFTIVGPIVGLIVGIICLICSYNSGYSLSIKSSAVSGVGLSVGASDVSVSNGGFLRGLFSTSGQGAALSVSAAPTAEAVSMMNELGAIVLDLKIMGDRAIPKWQSFKSGAVDMSAMASKLKDAVDLSGIKNVASRVQSGVAAAAQQQPQPPQQPAYNAPPQAGQQPVYNAPPQGQQPPQYYAPPAAPSAPPPPPPPPGRATVPPAQQGADGSGGFFG